MKERELREASKCGLCGRGVMADGIPLFYRVTIERHGIKADAVRRQSGLEMMLGGAVGIARALGPDEDMTEPMMDPVKITVCEHCSMNKSIPVAVLALEKV